MQAVLKIYFFSLSLYGGILKKLWNFQCIPVLAFLVFPFSLSICVHVPGVASSYLPPEPQHTCTPSSNQPLQRSLYHLDPILIKSVSPFSTVNFSLYHSDTILIILLQFWLFPKVSTRYKQLLRSTLAFCPNQNRNIYMRNILTKTINHKKHNYLHYRDCIKPNNSLLKFFWSFWYVAYVINQPVL